MSPDLLPLQVSLLMFLQRGFCHHSRTTSTSLRPWV